MIKNELHDFEDLFSRQGTNAALKFLNQRVPHRFSAIYRLDKNDLEIVELIDKLDDAATAPLSRVPFSQSFCEIAVRDAGVKTSNSALDKKLDGLPNQGVLLSYVGLPLMQQAGNLYGTLCHYDTIEQDISDAEFAFLQQAAALMNRLI